LNVLLLIAILLRGTAAWVTIRLFLKFRNWQTGLFAAMAVFIFARTYIWLEGIQLWPIDFSYRTDHLINAITGGFVLFFAYALHQLFSELRNQIEGITRERDAKDQTELALLEANRNLEQTNEELEVSVAQRTEQLMRELNERIYAEKALKESEDRLLDLVNSMSDGIWEADANCKIGFLSGNYTNLYQFGDKQEIRESLTACLELILSKLAEQKEDGNATIKDEEVELNLSTKNSVYMRLNGKPVWDEQGDLIGYRGTVSDITEARLAAKINDDLIGALDKFESGMAMWDNKNRLVTCNQRFKHLMEIPQDLLVKGLEFENFINLRADIVHQYQPEVDKKEWVSKRRHGHQQEFSAFEYQTKDDNWILCTKQKLTDGGVITLHSDITELKKHQENLEIARHEAEHANQAKSEFLSSMSHELRTPLNGILGFGQLLVYDQKNPLTDTQDENVRLILSCGEHLLALINEVLDLAKIESGNVTLSIEPLAVTNIIGECLEMTETVLEEYDVTLTEIPLDKSLPFISADFTRAKQILINLISNAAKYNREGGTISVQCAPTESDRFRISVQDTGYGIPEHKQSELFKPFSRLGRETSEIEGSGIGLTVTKQLVELMGGRIGFESKENVGSTFWFELPLAEELIEEEEEGSKEYKYDDIVGEQFCAQNKPNKTALYVEDNPANLSLMKKIFERMPNIRLVHARTGEIGIEMAEECMPDVILMDINLPGMDGVEALRHIRKIDSLNCVPAIVVSANAMPKEIEKAMDAGFQQYVTKPINIKQIVEIVTVAVA